MSSPAELAAPPRHGPRSPRPDPGAPGRGARVANSGRSGSQRSGPAPSPSRHEGRGPGRAAGGDAADHLSARAAGQPAQGRNRPRHPREPGRDHRGGDRLGQDDPDPQDLPRARPGRQRADRPHPAAPAGGPDGGRADRRGAGQPARPDRRVPGAVHRCVSRRHADQADDRRHPADRAGPRPEAQPLRHADHRRGPRAQPEHRLHPGLPPAAAARTPRPQGDHHLGHHRSGALRRGFRRRADHRGVRPHVSRRGTLPAHRGRGRRRPGPGHQRRDRRAVRRGAR